MDNDNYGQIKHLVATVGKWNLTDYRAIYQAPQPEFGVEFGIRISGFRFSEGDANVTVEIFEIEKDPSGRISIGYREPNADYLIVGIGGNNRAHTLYQYRGGIGLWELIVLSGQRCEPHSWKAANNLGSCSGTAISF